MVDCYGKQAKYRSGQLECIEAILDQKTVLAVKKTGWGKSLIYFVATKSFRLDSGGPTLVISPLSALIRNQVDSAKKHGLRAGAILHTNKDEWEEIETQILNNELDMLFISPERLSAKRFKLNILPHLEDLSLLVVDEAHCISDWGHDFRPDYKRISRLINLMPSKLPVLAMTATANDRVIEDIAKQIGRDFVTLKGGLKRENLILANIKEASLACRLAKILGILNTLEGSGIVYALTKRNAEQVSSWLRANGIDAHTYHSDVDPDKKIRLENELISNKIKVLVATTALGMGFDKPDLRFVIHYQRPSSVIHYYQQVGRAGRSNITAYGFLFYGDEDERISNFFIENAFPPQAHFELILKAVKESDDGLSVAEVQKKINLRKGQIEKAIKLMSVQDDGPIIKVGSKWVISPSIDRFSLDKDLIEKVQLNREMEQLQMKEYSETDECLMKFLTKALDDKESTECGVCVNCTDQMIEIEMSASAEEAMQFLKESYQTLPPRKQWPHFKGMSKYGFSGNIRRDLRAEQGRALSLWKDSAWGSVVAKCREECEFNDELLHACVKMINSWEFGKNPTWICCIPSSSNPMLVPSFAMKLAKELGIDFVSCISKVEETRPQKAMLNSYHQATNLDGAFEVDSNYVKNEPCLLFDDIVDSGWTFTVASALLRSHTNSEVYPVALALVSPRQE